MENEIASSIDESRLASMYEKDMKSRFGGSEKKAYNWSPYANEDKMLTLYWKSSINPDMYDTVKREIFWTFVNNKKFKFIKVGFKSKSGMMMYHNYLKEKQTYHESIFGTEKIIKFKLFHSDIEPLLKFFHDSKIKPSGWIKLKEDTYILQSPNSKIKHSTCQINITTDWSNVEHFESVDIAPFRTASFDIECSSSHGEFPLAKKDCHKLANQLVIAWIRDKKNIIKYKESRHNNENHNLLYKKALSSIKTEWKYFYDRLLISLDKTTTSKKNEDGEIKKIYFKNENRRDIDKLVNSSKFEALARQIYQICNRDIKKLKANKKLKAAVAEAKDRYDRKIEKLTAEGKTPNIHTLIKIIEKVAKEYNDDVNVPFDQLRDKMVTKEILVQCVNYKLNALFPSVKGDEIIQIGT